MSGRVARSISYCAGLDRIDAALRRRGQANIISFAQDLAANNRDYRLGLVTFEDYVISKYPDCNCPYRNTMTSNVHQFTDWVSGLHAGGGGDIPEDQLDALAYAASFPFRPEAEGIIILVTDAPAHHAGDGSAYAQHDQAYHDHHPGTGQVTDLTGDATAALLKKNGLTLYAVVPPPFIAPEYQKIVEETHGKSYNIITEEGRFAELVREIGHSIATQYSLTYRTPRPIEDGTTVIRWELQITCKGQKRIPLPPPIRCGVGGAAINVPEDGGARPVQGTGEPVFIQLVERLYLSSRFSACWPLAMGFGVSWSNRKLSSMRRASPPRRARGPCAPVSPSPGTALASHGRRSIRSTPSNRESRLADCRGVRGAEG